MHLKKSELAHIRLNQILVQEYARDRNYIRTKSEFVLLKKKKIDIIIIIIRLEKWNFEKPNLLLKQIDRQSLCRSHNSYAAAAVGSSRYTLLRWSKVFLYGASWHIICTQWNIFLLQSVHESTETCDFASIRVPYICRYAYSRTCS